MNVPARRSAQRVGRARRLGALLLMATTVVATTTVIGGPAHADPYGSPLTFGCGSKTAQINWKSTGTVRLFGGPDRETAGNNLLREVTKSGSYSYNSGYRTFTFQFGATNGHITSIKEVCVSQS
ncbi:hypothetical protein ACWGJ9_01460 [Curtobacterium citreum]